MWIIFAFLSAFTAALVAIFGKIGLKNLDSTFATTIRSIVMALFLIITSFFLGKFNGVNFHSLDFKNWMWVVLAGISGALSWLFYFLALKMTSVTKVVVIDRLSLVIAIIMASLFLGEAIGWKTVVGALMMVMGAIIISLA